MELVLIMMQCVTSLLYIVILISKIGILHKMLFIGVIYISSKFNYYLHRTIKQKLSNNQLIKSRIEKGEDNIHGMMPSGHAHYISFYIGVLYLFYMKTMNSKVIDNAYIYILLVVTCMIYVYEFIVCMINNYHTPSQYLVGTIFGILGSFVPFFMILSFYK